MKEDRLENQIRELRPLDVEDVPAATWKGISARLPKPERQSSAGLSYWKAAAVLFFFSTLGLVLWLTFNPQGNRLASLGDISQEYRLMEENYRRNITEVRQSIRLTAEEKKEYQWIFDELAYLDQLNREYRGDLKSEKNREQLVPILIDYYEKKLKLLRKLELEINRKKNEKSNETQI